MSQEREFAIIKKAMREMGTKRISALDGSVTIVNGVYYKFCVNNCDIIVEKL